MFSMCSTFFSRMASMRRRSNVYLPRCFGGEIRRHPETLSGVLQRTGQREFRHAQEYFPDRRGVLRRGSARPPGCAGPGSFDRRFPGHRCRAVRIVESRRASRGARGGSCFWRPLGSCLAGVARSTVSLRRTFPPYTIPRLSNSRRFRVTPMRSRYDKSASRRNSGRTRRRLFAVAPAPARVTEGQGRELENTPEGDSFRIEKARDEMDEAAAVMSRIACLVSTGERRPGEIAILTN